MRALSVDELLRLEDAFPDRYRAIIPTAGWLGHRFSEIAGTKVSHARFLERKLDVREVVVEVGGRLYVGPPKTDASRRTVTMPASLADVLAEHVTRYPDASGQGYLFTSPEGGPLRRSNFTHRVFIPAVHKAGFDDLRFHDLRHTAASLAIAAGAHPKQIQARLGHASITTTLNRYGHILPTLDERLADELDAVARNAIDDARKVVAIR